MFPANITRSEARERAALLHTEAYRILVNLTGRDASGAPLARPDENFVSTSTITFTSEAGDTFANVIADEVISASLDGAELDPKAFHDHKFPFSVTAGEHELTITALMRFSRSGQGLHRFVDPADDRVYTYTQFESADARRMYANFEQPDLKATFTISVLAPRGWTVVSNSAAVEPSDIDHGNQRWDFAETKKISTYITAIIAGEYHRVPTEVTSTAGPVPGSLLCRQSLVEHLDTDRIMATTQAGFKVFEEHFGVAYPFGTYDQAFVPEYNMGAMENAGCVTYRDEYLFSSRATAAQYESRDNTILHELAHMWFGDLVTMRWWDDLWLKESFAEFASHFAQAEYGDDPNHPWASFSNARKIWAYRDDQLPSTHPIAADMVDLEAVELNFDGITYAKGASVLRQLVAFVGREAFLDGAKEYFATHAYGNTDLSDLLVCLEKTSGRDLASWSKQWLESTGVNTLRAEIKTDRSGVVTSLVVHQSATEQHPTLRDHRIGIGFYEVVDGRLTRVQSVEVDVTGATTEVPALVGKQRPDLVLLNDDDLSYTKIRLDRRSLQTVVEHIDLLDNELSRALLWGCAWDMCRDAELTVDAYLSMVLNGIGTESDLTAVSRVLGQAQVACDQYAPAQARPALRNRLTAGLAALLRDAEPGSDHQLVFARSLASAIESDAGITLLTGWLAGEEVPDGLSVDQELRWHLFTELAQLGGTDEAAIAAELKKDNTISGAEKAAGARAALPDAEAKGSAWNLATNTRDVPNETQRQVCQNFWQPGQDEVLAEYVDRYFDLAEMISGQKGVWEHNGLWLSQNALKFLFPAVTDDSLVERIDAWLADARLHDSARKIVLDGRDGAVRAARARTFNAPTDAD